MHFNMTFFKTSNKPGKYELSTLKFVKGKCHSHKKNTVQINLFEIEIYFLEITFYQN